MGVIQRCLLRQSQFGAVAELATVLLRKQLFVSNQSIQLNGIIIGALNLGRGSGGRDVRGRGSIGDLSFPKSELPRSPGR